MAATGGATPWEVDTVEDQVLDVPVLFEQPRANGGDDDDVDDGAEPAGAGAGGTSASVSTSTSLDKPRSHEGRGSRHRRRSRPMSPSRELRSKIESLLRAEARLADRLTSSSRRLLARKAPLAFMEIVQSDILEIERCIDHASTMYALNNAALLLQSSKRHGPRETWTGEQQQRFEDARAQNRRRSRNALVELDLLRDQKRTQAIEIFERVAPTLSTREKWLRKRLIVVRNESNGSSDAKQHLATAARQYQEEVRKGKEAHLVKEAAAAAADTLPTQHGTSDNGPPAHAPSTKHRSVQCEAPPQLSCLLTPVSHPCLHACALGVLRATPFAPPPLPPLPHLPPPSPPCPKRWSTSSPSYESSRWR